MIKRKKWRSDTFLSDRELKLIKYFESKTWLNEPLITVSKTKLKQLDHLWEHSLKCLEFHGRVSNVHVYRTKIFLEVVPKPEVKKEYVREKKYTYG